MPWWIRQTMATVGMAILTSPLHLVLCERKEVLAPQPMLFTVQYILSTLLRILSTWENSHSFPLLHLSSFFRSSFCPVRLCRHFTIRFLSSSFSRLFLSTALNLLPVLSNKVYGSAGVDLYREKKGTNARERNSCVRARSRSLYVVAGAIVAAFLWIATAPRGLTPQCPRVLQIPLRDISHDITFTLVSKGCESS